MVKLFNESKLQSLNISSLLEGEEYSNAFITEVDLSNQTSNKISFDSALLRTVNMTAVVIKKFTCIKVQFAVCDFSNANFEKGYFSEVLFSESKLTGLKSNESDFKNCIFSDCKADYLQCQETSFKKTIFEECYLYGAFFHGSDLTEAVFHNCDLTDADFSNTRLKGADFRGSKINGIKFDMLRLKDVIFDYNQAIYLSQLLGIKIMN